MMEVNTSEEELNEHELNSCGKIEEFSSESKDIVASREVLSASSKPNEGAVFNNEAMTNNCLTLDKSDLLTLAQGAPTLSGLRSSNEHTFLIKYSFTRGSTPEPWPYNYVDKWDDDHVKLPCSPKSVYPVAKDGMQTVVPRWDIVQKSLLSPMHSSKDIEYAILKYNKSQPWNFDALHEFFDCGIEEEEAVYFFDNIMPKVVQLALDLPKIVTQPIPLLKRGKNHSITLSQKMVGSLLANAFFCTYPRRNSLKRTAEYSTYPTINFNSLFSSSRKADLNIKFEKLKCLLHYFRIITSSDSRNLLTFTRVYKCHSSLPDWVMCGQLPRLFMSTGAIESSGRPYLQVDFANKMIGGGVLGYGSVQEEIRFLISPELIVSRLFTECLDDTECLIMTGAQQYSQYSGYSDTFKWEGPFNDTTLKDAWNRKYCQIVAIDAIQYDNPLHQYKESNLIREINKAFIGFSAAQASKLPAVATGNWGCGAFKGHVKLKFLIQLLAAGEAKRDLAYFTFGDEDLKSECENVYSVLAANNFTIGDVWKSILKYANEVQNLSNSFPNIFEFIMKDLMQLDSDIMPLAPLPSTSPKNSPENPVSYYPPFVSPVCKPKGAQLKQSKINSFFR